MKTKLLKCFRKRSTKVLRIRYNSGCFEILRSNQVVLICDSIQHAIKELINLRRKFIYKECSKILSKQINKDLKPFNYEYYLTKVPKIRGKV